MKTNVCANRSLPGETELFGTLEGFEETFSKGPAIVSSDGVVTRAELDSRAACVAWHLLSLGIAPGSLIAVCLERSPEWVASLLGIFKAGCAYLPLDPAYPADRLAFMLQDANVAALLAGSAIEKLPRGPWLSVDVREAMRSKAPAQWDPAPPAAPGDLAYVIYTSGSTGQPKGVEVAHGSLSNLIDWHLRTFNVTGADRATLVSSPGFDAGVWELWPYLKAGASLYLPDEEVRLTPALLRDYLVSNRITISFLPTPLAERVMGLEWPKNTALRTLLTGGDRLLRHPPAGLPFTVVNNYGPTECTVVATSTALGAAHNGDLLPPIGLPIANTEIYILDERLKPVSNGAEGEIYIGGAGVARGYRNRAGATTERFIPHPFSTDSSARLYRTGDLAKYLPDGQIHFLGRTDEQVKIRGFRIEPAEIAAALNRHPNVRASFVVAHEFAPEDKRLVAYVVPAAGGRRDSRELREFLRASVPEYMVPSEFEFLDELPLTANGKVDRRALPMPRIAPQERRDARPRTPVEARFTAILAELLRVSDVGLEDNFFELGGHSLLGAQVIARVTEVFGVELSLRTVFDHPTAAEIAAEIERRAAGTSSAIEGPHNAATAPCAALAPCATAAPCAQEKPFPTPAPQTRMACRPLSGPESRLWFVQSSDPDCVAYNVWRAMRLSSRVDPSALRAALLQTIARHDILRTTYEVRDGVPEAVIDRQSRLDWLIEEVTDEQSAKQAALKHVSVPFAIDRGPLIRMRLLRWRADEQILLFIIHHLVCDGPSVNLLWNEVSRSYAAYQEGGRADLPALHLQYGDWAARQNLELASERAARGLAFWTEKLANPPAVTEFPGARRRPSKPSFRGRWESLPLSKVACTAVRRLAAEERTTPFTVYLSAFLLLLNRSTGATDLSIGTPASTRRGRDAEPLIGLFANMLALRFNLEGDPTFREWLRHVRDNCLEYFEHADTPIESVIQASRLERSQAVQPLFQMAFMCEPAPEASPLVNVPLDNGSAKFDLSLSIESGPAHADCTLEYSTDLYDAAVAHQILENFRALAQAAVEDPDAACSRVPLAQDACQAWHGAQVEYPAKPVHAVFEETAVRFSGREALVCGAERVSYAELNRRANLLAESLKAEGVQPGERIAILMERSAEYVAALLAVLKCGGTWVPLALSDPPARTRAILEDCGARIVMVKERLPHKFDPGRAKAFALPALEGRADPGNPSGSVPIDQPACVMYTSGSTGAPKGVLVRHRGILRLLFGVDYAELGPQTTTLYMAPLQFDASTFELFGAILHGGRCVIAREGFRGIEEFGQLVAREGVNTCWLTASLFNAVVEQSVEALRPIRQLLTGGEALSPEHVRRALEALPETQIVNGYGPTETTTFACCHRIERPLDPDARSIPIGHPIANTELLVLDRHMRPLPPCALGELFIGGDGVAQGYLNAPGPTAERFVEVPDVLASGGRFYRTGDLVYTGPDNLLYYAGRTDEQVKIRGYRVEPGEVESALLRLPEIKHAAVIARPEPAGAMSLIAYYVAREGGQLEEAGVRAALQRVLPGYMVPARAVRVAAIPLKPSGKVDRDALPAPPARETKSNGLAHVDPTELILLRIWQRLFHGRRISVEDDFFSLGGHSLMAVRLMAQVEREFGKRLPASVLFEAPTVSALAKLLTGGEEPKGKAEFAALQPFGDRPPLFFVGAGPKQKLFAERLGADQPCLSPVPRFHHDYGSTFLMDLATRYAMDIRRCQPHGPYYLAGWSRCGLLALEIAQRLRAAGEQVALLVLVDTYLPGAFRSIGVRDRFLARAARAMRLLGVLRRLPVVLPRDIRNGRIRQRLADIAAGVQQSGLGRRLWKLRSAILQKLLNRRVVIEGWHDLAFALATSAEAYVPRTYDSRVLFLLAEDKPAGSAFDPLQGWYQFLAKVDVERVPGDHETMFRVPNVDVVARAVSKYLS